MPETMTRDEPQGLSPDTIQVCWNAHTSPDGGGEWNEYFLRLPNGMLINVGTSRRLADQLAKEIVAGRRALAQGEAASHE